nr:hypothetical protein [Caviibacter abscessus]
MFNICPITSSETHISEYPALFVTSMPLFLQISKLIWSSRVNATDIYLVLSNLNKTSSGIGKLAMIITSLSFALSNISSEFLGLESKYLSVTP